jgi:Family of unknown function (DUF6335)
MAKKKAARPTAKKAKKAPKKSARKTGRSAPRPAARKAKKAPARKAAKPASTARKPAPTSSGKKVSAKKATRTAAKKVRPVTATRRTPPAKVARKAAPARNTAKKAPTPKPRVSKKTAVATKAAPAAPKAKGPSATPALRRIANLDRPRRTVADIHGVPSSLDMDRTASAVRSGRAELEHQIHEQTNTSPALTAGDVDADWGGASAVGDEAPGGDNPTPDQDVVEEIGRALGVEYDDDEELQGGDEIAARDRHRWELDPESSDDFDER